MSKNTPTLLKTAAEMRSNGASWAAVGRSVGRSPRTCEQWPRLFRPTWDGLYRDAEGRRFTETGGEATAVLQKLLRDGDDKTKLRSADVLLRTRHQQLMREPATALPLSVADTAALKLGRRFQAEKALDEKKPVLQCSADNLPPAAANDPNDILLCDSTELHSDVVAENAEPDPAALPTPAAVCPAPSKSHNFSLRGMAFGVLLLIFTLLLTAFSQRQSDASGGFDSSGKEAREPARYRAIPLEKPIEKVLNPAAFENAEKPNEPQSTRRKKYGENHYKLDGSQCFYWFSLCLCVSVVSAFCLSKYQNPLAHPHSLFRTTPLLRLPTFAV